MISLEDARWPHLTGGYRMPFDPRPLLQRLETVEDTAEVWEELWDELHHQGDVGEASYAAVPFFVKNYRERGRVAWNTFAMVAIIELARNKGDNPDVPQWLAGDYFAAIRELAEIGASEVLRAEDADEARAILSVIAIHKGLPFHGEFLVKYEDDELTHMEFKD